MNTAARTDQNADPGLPLAGLRVIEFCHIVMGPSCGLVLAELGADVIKVEPAPEGDRTRNLQGHVAGSFTFFNRSKRSIGLNLKTEEGQAIAYRLLADADAMTENFAPGTADRLGIGYEAVSAINPRIVYCSLKGYLPGPYGKRAALDEIVQYNTGLAYMTGLPDRPLRAGASVSDMTGGIFGAVGILAALRQRDITGRGTHVQSGLYESCAFLIGQHMAGQVSTGKDPQPLSVRPRSWGIYDTFKTRDGRTIFVGITSDRQWKAFCERFGREDLLADPTYDTNEKRRAAHGTLYGAIQAMFLEHDCDPLSEILVEIGLPAAPMRTPAELFDDPQLIAAGRMSSTRFANGKVANLPRLPLDFGGSKAVANGQAPEFAEDTDEVLSEIGIGAQELTALRARGVVT